MLLETFLQDLRISLRVLRKEKGFCALATLVLALGIGAVTTMFAVVNGALLRGFSFRDADRLVDVQLVDASTFHPDNFNARTTTMDLKELREMKLNSFEAVSGYVNGSAATGYIKGATVNLTYAGRPRRYTGCYVTHDFFRTLGIAPALGRDFTEEDDRPGTGKVIILSDALWKTDFAADPGVIGRAVRANGTVATVIGVMPPKFQFPDREDLWIPINTAFPPRRRNDPAVNYTAIIAKLKPGVSLAQAREEIDGAARKFAADSPDTNRQFSMGYVRPLIESFTSPQLRRVLCTMLAFCGGVLLISCANVMNMQFARGTLRARELAIRSALGAKRHHLFRQMLTESLLLAVIGSALGIIVAQAATEFVDAAAHNLADPVPSWMHFDIEPKVLLATIAATLIAVVASGLLPALSASRAVAADVLKESGRGNTGRAAGTVTRGLVALQICVTCLLLIAALLLVQSLVRQRDIDHGYDTRAILAARLGLMEGDYPTNAARRLFYEKLIRELRATPDFAAVALTSRLQMAIGNTATVEIEGRQYARDSDRATAQLESVSSDYADTLGQKTLAGRYFTDDDSDQREPVAIVNASFAQKHFGNDPAVGRRLRTISPNGENPGPWRRIVGVVTDIRMVSPLSNQNDNAGFYVPFFANPFGPTTREPVARQFGSVVARPRGDQRGESLVRSLTAAVQKIDPDLPPYYVETPRRSIDGFLSQNRVVATMFAFFGIVAVLLASVGLYGVQSFAVNQRTQEFGIRMALGADNRQILGLVFRQGLWTLTLGLGGGLGFTLLLALLGRQGIQNFLFGITPTDPVTYIAVALLLTLVCFAAILLPARRATRVDPMIALRAE